MRNCESEEMYLETILVLSRENGQVRRVDIAGELDVSRPSVTTAIKSLQAKDYVYDDAFGNIHLTEDGRAQAESVYEKHHLLTRLLMHIGANPVEAENNACRMEHVVSEELTEIIRRFVDESPAFG